MKIQVLPAGTVQQPNGLPKAGTCSSWNIHSVMGGDRASGKCLRRRATFPLSNTLPHGKQSALSQDLRKSLARLFLPSFLFMGVKECSAVMKTGMGCSPQKFEHSVLRMRVRWAIYTPTGVWSTTQSRFSNWIYSANLQQISAFQFVRETASSARGFWRERICLYGSKMRKEQVCSFYTALLGQSSVGCTAQVP